jgi:hypothetical protein
MLEELNSSFDRPVCLFCVVVDMLRGMEVFTWLAVLLWTDHIDEYERSLAFLDSDGDDVISLESRSGRNLLEEE